MGGGRDRHQRHRDSSRRRARRPYPRGRAFLRGCAALGVRGNAGALSAGRGAAWVVDISGPAQTFNPQSLALAAAISREMEASLDQALKLEHDVLWRYFVAKRSIWLSEEMLLVDSRGSLVHATPKALRTLDGSQPQT